MFNLFFLYHHKYPAIVNVSYSPGHSFWLFYTNSMKKSLTKLKVMRYLKFHLTLDNGGRLDGWLFRLAGVVECKLLSIQRKRK